MYLLLSRDDLLPEFQNTHLPNITFEMLNEHAQYVVDVVGRGKICEKITEPQFNYNIILPPKNPIHS